jgi:hypothetical protein
LREEAAKLGCIARHCVTGQSGFHEQEPDDLINIPSRGAPPLDDLHNPFLSRIVDEVPIPAVHIVVR